jgi:hypothetical protein
MLIQSERVKSVASGSSAKRGERRNRSVLDVHEDFEHPRNAAIEPRCSF